MSDPIPDEPFLQEFHQEDEEEDDGETESEDEDEDEETDYYDEGEEQEEEYDETGEVVVQRNVSFDTVQQPRSAGFFRSGNIVDLTASNSALIVTLEEEEDEEEEEEEEEARNKRKRRDREAPSSSGVLVESSEWNRSEIDGLFCPICMEAWSNEGDHHICCLPCGHIYGMSCIRRWLEQRKNSAKCPQCNRRCTLKDVRKLFASRVVTVDEESQKRIRYLESKCAALEKQNAEWKKIDAKWKAKDCEWSNRLSEWEKKIAGWDCMVSNVEQRISRLEETVEHIMGDIRSGSHGLGSGAVWWGHSASGKDHDLENLRDGSCCTFVSQTELRVDGARLFDISASNQLLLIARRQSGIGVGDVLTKVSLIYPHETEDIVLPSNTKAVRDLHVSPSNGALAMVSSLGKTLSLVSLESNNIVLSYDLPAAAWSCSWDQSSPHHVYAGLQNGMLLLFDMRQTRESVESLNGLTCNPIHSVHSLSKRSGDGFKPVLSASSIGLCQWNIGFAEERPTLIPETANEGVCISLAYCPRSDQIVASYRPKVEMSGEVAFSQSTISPSPGIDKGTRGSHVLFKRIGSKSYQKLGSVSANVSDVRLPRSLIIKVNESNPLFASGDEATNELILHTLPSFSLSQRLKLRKHQFRDVRYTTVMNQGLLSCLTDDTVQVFSTQVKL